MKSLMIKIIFPALCVIALFAGVWGGIKWREHKNSKTVVFRISTEKKHMDYDMLTAVNYLQYILEKQGYTVMPWRYPGKFYHQKGDNAAINFFIRNNEFFYDTRMNKKAVNIYYLHRFMAIYAEELQGYNYYLSSQKNLQKALSEYKNIFYFGVGAIPHKKLTPKYEYDILYITEKSKQHYLEFINQKYQIKYYNGYDFARQSPKEREKLLSEARLVVYDIEKSPVDDADYTPYAVYDIISYGRPLLTNITPHLYKNIGTDIYYYRDDEEMMTETVHALSEKDDIREAKATKARKKVISAAADASLNLPLKD